MKAGVAVSVEHNALACCLVAHCGFRFGQSVVRSVDVESIAVAMMVVMWATVGVGRVIVYWCLAGLAVGFATVAL